MKNPTSSEDETAFQSISQTTGLWKLSQQINIYKFFKNFNISKLFQYLFNITFYYENIVITKF